MAIATLATAYAERRDAESLHALRTEVLRSPGYDAGLNLLSEVAELLEDDDYAAVISRVRGHMPGAFFSPAAHALLATSHEALGDTTRASRERRAATLAMESILTSGDGTSDRPWSVLRISDEYDVLRARGRKSTRQTYVTRRGRELDHHRLDDGSEAWFDIDLFMGRQR